MSLSVSFLTAGANHFVTTAEHENNLAKDIMTQGIIGSFTNNQGSGSTGAFGLDAQGSPDRTINVRAGVAYVTATPSTQRAQLLRVEALTDQTVTHSTNVTGSTVYDWVYIKIDTTLANAPDVNGTTVATLFVSRSTSSTSDTGTPPTTGLLLGVVTLANSYATITNTVIAGRATASSLLSASAGSGWVTGLVTPNTVTYNGNHNYSLVFNSTNLTTTLSPGMRLKLNRTVAAPIQCTSLNGTTQYYSKSSPAAMTFTDDFVVTAKIKINAYPATAMIIASRVNGTQGWELYVNSDGTIHLSAYNASLANYGKIQSYGAIPVGKWVDVAAQLDMSAFTATTTTSYVMIDGVDVPSLAGRAGTNPTALVQAGNLEIGSHNGGLLPFNGKLAQVAIYNAKVTQATLVAAISQGLAGTETSLISAYSFNNSVNDLNVTNANNLTANGSAVATNADSPFGTQADGSILTSTDYGIVVSTSFSTNTTIVVQVPEGNTFPTSGGVIGVSYSPHKAPYGMPMTRNKYTIDLVRKPDEAAQSSPTASTWYNPTGLTATLPIGSWDINRRSNAKYVYNGTTVQTWSTVSTSASSESNPELTTYNDAIMATSTTQQAVIPHNLYTGGAFAVSAATPLYLLIKTAQASVTTIALGTGSPGTIPTLVQAICAYV